MSLESYRVSGRMGPLDIYNVAHPRLLILWLTMHPGTHSREFWFNKRPKTVHRNAATLLDEVADSGQKQTARIRLEWVLRRYGCRAAKLYHRLEDHPSVPTRELLSTTCKSLSRFEHPCVASLVPWSHDPQERAGAYPICEIVRPGLISACASIPRTGVSRSRMRMRMRPYPFGRAHEGHGYDAPLGALLGLPN